MTNFVVESAPFNPEDLSWDLSGAGDQVYAEGGTLDITSFNSAQHFPNGYIPSGTVLGKITATGLLGPYLSTASDGRQTAVGILRASVQVWSPLSGQNRAKSGCAVVKAFNAISQGHLPFTSSNAALGGYLDAGAITSLKNLYFAA